MMRVRRAAAASVLALGAAGLSACSPGGPASQGPSTSPPAPPASSAPAQPGSEVSPAHNQADVQFVKMMVPHHQQALRMAEIVLPKQGLDPQVRQMTEKIQREQGPEIAKMQSWLGAWNAGPAMSLEQARGMRGLLSPEDLVQLERADGATASKLLLQQMTEHHRGAVSMSGPETHNGTNPQAKQLAHSIVASQQQQIQQMQSMLDHLEP